MSDNSTGQPLDGTTQGQQLQSLTPDGQKDWGAAFTNLMQNRFDRTSTGQAFGILQKIAEKKGRKPDDLHDTEPKSSPQPLPGLVKLQPAQLPKSGGSGWLGDLLKFFAAA